MRALTTLTALTMVMAGSADAQGQRNGVPVLFGVVRQIEPPPGSGAWVMQVITRGGVDGHGTGDFAISSDGTLTLFRRADVAGLGARAVVPPDVLRLLGQRISSAASQWKDGPRLGMCSDCVATLIVVILRESDGRPRSYTAYWDVTTKGSVPADVLRMYDLALTLHRQ